MIRTRLPVQRRVDCKALILHNSALIFQGGQLPAHERIIVWIDIGGDERAAPVDAAAEQ